MRIIGGSWRGRQIAVPKGSDVRPTGDRVREAWLSIIQFDVPNARVVDLCAGSGALGIEALSRGASHVTFVDTSSSALAGIEKNLAGLGAPRNSFTLQRGDAEQFVRSVTAQTFTLGFADPPYASTVAAALSMAWNATHFATVLGIEHPSALSLDGGGEQRRYGQTAITFFRG